MHHDKNLGPVPWEEKVDRAFDEAFTEVLPLAEGRIGGVATILDRRSQWRRRKTMGTIPRGKFHRYSGNATRKRDCLKRKSVQRLDASYMYRQPEANPPLWGGGVRANRFIVSFSGFPELVDELFSLLVLYKLGSITSDEIFQILGRTKNPIALRYFQMKIGGVA